MKKLFLVALLGLLSNIIIAQSVDGIDLVELRQEYIGIECINKDLSGSNFAVFLDFGQERKIPRAKNMELIDIDGSSKRFNSEIEALNFMHKYGYAVVDATNHTDCNYLLKRRKEFENY